MSEAASLDGMNEPAAPSSAHDRTVVVAGAGGAAGREVCAALTAAGAYVVAVMLIVFAAALTVFATCGIELHHLTHHLGQALDPSRFAGSSS